MARPLRVEYEGAFYHITARGNERKNIFFTKRDYERFKEYLVIAQERLGCILHVYVLMNNHYHLLLETPQGNLGKVMHYLNGSYTTYINVKRKRSGHLFQGRYKSIVIERDSYLLELSRYIHLNPVRANITERPEDYPHSSYAAYLEKGNSDIIFRNKVLAMLACNKGEVFSRYREFVESAIGIKMENPLKNSYGGMALGGERFVRGILGQLEDSLVDNEEVSYRKALLSTTSTDNVINKVCEYMKCSRQNLSELENRTERNIAIYLLKKQTAASNKEIGEILGGLSYSAVAKAYQRFGKRLEGDGSLSHKVKELSSKLS